jgi:hypothetical protein
MNWFRRHRTGCPCLDAPAPDLAILVTVLPLMGTSLARQLHALAEEPDRVNAAMVAADLESVLRTLHKLQAVLKASTP